MKKELTPSQKITIVFEGQEYPVVRPKLGAARAFEEAMTEAKTSGNGTIACVMDYVLESGLPKEVVDKLDTEQLEEVCEILTPPKKKPLTP